MDSVQNFPAYLMLLRVWLSLPDPLHVMRQSLALSSQAACPS